MSNNDITSRIEINPRVMAGKPVIKGTRLTVQYIISMLGQGMTEDEILREYKGLAREDIKACLVYASQMLDGTILLSIDEAV
ncbi:MAG: DUF433 domain-containing protein [Spirochaetes bacterium]|nr:DUF433 domain-containing protein [Spirochaetota bacterium]